MRKSTYNVRHKIKLSNSEIHLLLLAKGFNISKTKVTELIRLEKNKMKESQLHIVHLPGEAVEFDWGTIYVQIGNKKSATKVSLAVFSFPYSNYKKVYALPNSTGKSFVTALKQFTKDMGGVPPKFILDNMRIARKFTSNLHSEVELTTLFKELCQHYNFEVSFCSPYCPNQKGNVENNVGVIKESLEKSYINSFKNLDDLQECIHNITNEHNHKSHPTKNDSCKNLIKHEQNRLLPLPSKEYIFYYQKFGKVNKNGMVRFDNNYYAVPEIFKGENVLLKFNDKTIYFLIKDGQSIIAKYTRSKKRGSRKYRVWYMLHKLKHKSNGFLDSEEYRSMPKPEKLILERIFKNDGDSFIRFLEQIKDKPRKLIRKFVGQHKTKLETFTPEQLINNILRI